MIDVDSSVAPVFDAAAIAGKAGSENFPVALRVLPRQQRDHLLAIYGFARLVDDIGDQFDGDRLGQLDWAERELDRALNGEPADPVLTAAAATARAIGAHRKPFVDLINANRQDQLVKRYANYDALARYCMLSANPVGRLVLMVFGHHDERTGCLSDSICTGLQLVEHWQDVAEDYAESRVYLPSDDLARFEVDERELALSTASAALRRLIAFECGRARTLLETGRPLIGLVNGTARLAIAGFIGGGLAQIKAIERAEFDVLGHRIKATKVAVAREALSLVLAGVGK